MNKSSRTSASDSDKTMPTRKQIAELFSKWAKDDGTVTYDRVCLELLGFSEHERSNQGNVAAPILAMRFVLEGIEKGHITREKLQAFLRKPQTVFGECNTVIIPACSEPFVIGDHFMEDAPNTAPVKVRISSLCHRFKRVFFDTVLTSAPEQTLRRAVLVRDCVDRSIIGWCGGEGAIETTLWSIWSLMVQQPSGESGVLLSNGDPNTFYLHDPQGALWQAVVVWYKGGWSLRVCEVSSILKRRKGTQVFSRSPLPSAA